MRKNNRPNGGGTFKEKIKKAFSKLVNKSSMDKIFAIDKPINNRKEFLTT